MPVDILKNVKVSVKDLEPKPEHYCLVLFAMDGEVATSRLARKCDDFTEFKEELSLRTKGLQKDEWAAYLYKDGKIAVVTEDNKLKELT